ncbi:MAG: hypothetical protein AAF193_11370 [Bacteroidota bacterium]
MAVIESEVRHWEQGNLEEKKLAWLWFQVTINECPIGVDNRMIILVYNETIDICVKVIGVNHMMCCVCETRVWNSLCYY